MKSNQASTGGGVIAFLAHHRMVPRARRTIGRRAAQRSRRESVSSSCLSRVRLAATFSVGELPDQRQQARPMAPIGTTSCSRTRVPPEPASTAKASSH